MEISRLALLTDSDEKRRKATKSNQNRRKVTESEKQLRKVVFCHFPQFFVTFRRFLSLSAVFRHFSSLSVTFRRFCRFSWLSVKSASSNISIRKYMGFWTRTVLDTLLLLIHPQIRQYVNIFNNISWQTRIAATIRNIDLGRSLYVFFTFP